MLDQSFLETIRATRWFERCGEPFATMVPLRTRAVSSWQEAIGACTALSYDDVTLAAQNRLTLFLHFHARSEYQKWNNIVVAAKEQCITPLAEEVWRPFAAEHGLPEGFVGCVQWDVLGAIMEHEYRRHMHRPVFFSHLLSIYQAGHFPCGWENGEFPEGTLLVF